MALTKDPAGNPPPQGGFREGGWYGSYQYWNGSFAPQAGQIHPSSNQQGAGQAVSPEINRQTSVAAGLAPTANQEYIDKQNAQVSPENFGSFLDSYQQSVYDSLGGGGGFPQLSGGAGDGALSFEDIKSRLAPSTARPEPFSRVAKFEEMRAQYGVEDLETQLNDLKAQQRDMEAQLRVNVAGERGKPVAQGVIERRIGEHTRQSREDLEFVNRQQAYLTDQLNSAYQIINTYVQFGAADYQDAVQRYNDEFSQNLNLMELARGLRKDQISEDQRRIDNARATLSTFVNAITAGNLDPSSINANQKLLIRKLETQSGLPIGFVESLDMSAKDRLLSFNERTGEALMMDANGSFQVVKTGATPTPFAPTGGTVGERKGEVQQTQRNEMDTLLASKANSYGDVPYQYWNEGKRLWLMQGLDGGDYDSIYYNYIDENRKTDGDIQDYNLSQ